jgi:hypothetical protein
MRDNARSHPKQNLGDSGRRALSSAVQPIEGREGGEDPDHIPGFPDRTSRPQPVVRGQSPGKCVIGFGLRGISSAAQQSPVKDRIRRPGGAGLLDSPPEICQRVRPSFRGRGFRARPQVCGERVEQPGFGSELVVDSDPGNSRELCHLAHADLGAKVGHQASGGGEDASSGACDVSGAPGAQSVIPGTHVGPDRLTDSLFNQVQPILGQFTAGAQERRSPFQVTSPGLGQEGAASPAPAGAGAPAG